MNNIEFNSKPFTSIGEHNQSIEVNNFELDNSHEQLKWACQTLSALCEEYYQTLNMSMKWTSNQTISKVKRIGKENQRIKTKQVFIEVRISYSSLLTFRVLILDRTFSFIMINTCIHTRNTCSFTKSPPRRNNKHINPLQALYQAKGN